jgi:peptidoglycan/LPS O-acetylase OafA/YrhL
MGKRHLALLDGILGLAALMVMTFHYFQISDHLIAGRMRHPSGHKRPKSQTAAVQRLGSGQ